MKNRGWQREPARHSLASRGKRTVQKKHANEPGPWKFQGYLPVVKDFDEMAGQGVGDTVDVVKVVCPECGAPADVTIKSAREYETGIERYWAYGLCAKGHEFAARPGYRSDGWRHIEYWANPVDDSAPKKRKMGLGTWVKANRSSIDAVIRSAVPGAKIDDDERELWVMNDEGLYFRAKNSGVDI